MSIKGQGYSLTLVKGHSDFKVKNLAFGLYTQVSDSGPHGPPVFFIGEPGLVDRVLALHAGSRGFDSHRRHISKRFFRSNRPGYPRPVSSELENSGIRVVVGDCSVTERRRWRPPYQTGKTVQVHAKHYNHKEDGRTAPCVCGNGSVSLSLSGNVVKRIGIHTHTFFSFFFSSWWLVGMGRIFTMSRHLRYRHAH